MMCPCHCHLIFLSPGHHRHHHCHRRFHYASLRLCSTPDSKLTFSINPFHRSLPRLFGRISRIFMTLLLLHDSFRLLITRINGLSIQLDALFVTFEIPGLTSWVKK